MSQLWGQEIWHAMHRLTTPRRLIIKRYRSFSVSTYFEAKSIGNKYRTKNKCTKEEYMRYKHFAASKGEIANYEDFKRSWDEYPDIIMELLPHEEVPTIVVCGDNIYSVRQTENGYYYI